MSKERATKKQQELLQFVDDFIREHGYGPSYREIMNGLGYKSVSTVATHIEGLITKGFLHRRDNSPRSLEVVTLAGDLKVETKTSTTIDEVTSRLKEDVDDADREVLLRALEVLGYEEKAKRLRSKYEVDSVETE